MKGLSALELDCLSAIAGYGITGDVSFYDALENGIATVRQLKHRGLLSGRGITAEGLLLLDLHRSGALARAE